MKSFTGFLENLCWEDHVILNFINFLDSFPIILNNTDQVSTNTTPQKDLYKESQKDDTFFSDPHEVYLNKALKEKKLWNP